MQLTFQPLRRNRYRAHYFVHGAPKSMIVKKGQIERTRRVLWHAEKNRMRRAAPSRTAPVAKMPIVDPNHPVDYLSALTPPSYKCGTCQASGCKLWRDYQTFLEHQELSCAVCAAASQKKDISDMGEDGRYTSKITHRKTDQIGWCVPAVPREQNDTFWGYHSVPLLGIEWWRRLPTFPVEA